MVYRYNPYASAVYYGGNDYRDYIAHFRLPGTPNKDHKYIKKIGEGAKAVYIYATNAAKNVGRGVGKFVDRNITGSSYKKNAAEWGRRATDAQDRARQYEAQKQYAAQKDFERQAAEYAGYASDQSKRYSKTLRGRVEGALSSIKNLGIRTKGLIGSLVEKGKSVFNNIRSKLFGGKVKMASGVKSEKKKSAEELKSVDRSAQRTVFGKAVAGMEKAASKKPKKGFFETRPKVNNPKATPLASPVGASFKNLANGFLQVKGLSDEDKVIWDYIVKSGVEINKPIPDMIDEFKRRNKFGGGTNSSGSTSAKPKTKTTTTTSSSTKPKATTTTSSASTKTETTSSTKPKATASKKETKTDEKQSKTFLDWTNEMARNEEYQEALKKKNSSTSKSKAAAKSNTKSTSASESKDRTEEREPVKFKEAYIPEDWDDYLEWYKDYYFGTLNKKKKK